MKRALLMTFIVPVASLSASMPIYSEPNFDHPDMAAIFDRVTPHFREGAGSPVPGMTRGVDLYQDDGFYVGKPEMVMPTGSGTLSAMVSYGDALELQLSKTGYSNAISDNKSGAPVQDQNSYLSPGHISLRLARAAAKDITKFDQRIDFARGSVIIELETAEGAVKIEVSGDMAQDNLVVSVNDNRRTPGDASIRYENWRDDVVIKDKDGKLLGEEAVDTSHAQGKKAQAMSLAFQVGCVNGTSFKTTTDKSSGSILVPKSDAGNFTVVISVKCVHGKPPENEVLSSWNATAGAASSLKLEKMTLDWWKDFWSCSWLDITGPEADYLTRLWYTTLYSYACVGEGSVPPNFNGGPGLVYKDVRSWGDSYVWQNQREISFWPMAAAGHPEFTRKALLCFNHAYDASQKNAQHYLMDGLLFMEAHNPCDDIVIGSSGAPENLTWTRGRWDTPFGEYPMVENQAEPFNPERIKPLEALKYRQSRRAWYNGLNFSGGLEFTQAIFNYVQYEGDGEILRKMAAPWLKGEALMCLSLLTMEEDGKYHVQCADATEEWWKVNDPAPLVAGVHYVLGMTVKFGKHLGFEDAFVAAARERLEKLAPLPTAASWSYVQDKIWQHLDNVISGNSLLVPFALSDGVQDHNAENPELYAVFPYGMADLNSSPADFNRGKETFNHRYFKNSYGWSQDGIQAARLGLPNTIDIILKHAHGLQVWPYGGWNSAAPPLYKGSVVEDCPYFDSAGENATALQESLLQSHSSLGDTELLESGPIRLLPAVSKNWSGQFRLHARGGFTVTVKFANGQATAARFDASRNAKLRICNPFAQASVWLNGKLTKFADKIISMEVKKGEFVVLTP